MCNRANPTDTMPARMMGKPVAQLVDAELAIAQLLQSNGEATSLTLKDFLRGQDFFCNQDMASYFLDRIHSDRSGTGQPNELERNLRGTYFVYTVITDEDDEDNDPGAALLAMSKSILSTPSNSISALAAGIAAATPSYKVANPVLIPDSDGIDLSTLDQKSWFCYTNSITTANAIVDKNLTREQARVQYANLRGIDYDDARACRVENAK